MYKKQNTFVNCWVILQRNLLKVIKNLSPFHKYNLVFWCIHGLSTKKLLFVFRERENPKYSHKSAVVILCQAFYVQIICSYFFLPLLSTVIQSFFLRKWHIHITLSFFVYFFKCPLNVRFKKLNVVLHVPDHCVQISVKHFTVSPNYIMFNTVINFLSCNCLHILVSVCP